MQQTYGLEGCHTEGKGHVVVSCPPKQPHVLGRFPDNRIFPSRCSEIGAQLQALDFTEAYPPH